MAWLLFIGSAVEAGSPARAESAEETSAGQSHLDRLVETYFRSDDPEARERIANSIEDAANGSIKAVVRSVHRANLWTALPQEEGQFEFSVSPGDTFSIGYRLPAGYDPAQRYPAVLCLPGEGAEAAQTRLLATGVLGEAARDFVRICPARPVGGAFHQPLGAAADFRQLMRQVRQRIHIDTDRFFLFGLGRGGDAAWMTALAHADLFAGVIVLSAYPPLPYPEQVYPFLLRNLRGVGVLSVWGGGDHPLATARQKAIAAHNRGIVKFAKKVGLDVVGVEVPYESLVDLTPPAGEVAKMLRRRRRPKMDEVSHWFRYPGQGHAGWLEQVKHGAEVWEADQLAILPAPGTDRDTCIADIVKEKLAYLGGRIEGQTITIESRKCRRVEVCLSTEALDWSRPVIVQCN
ncbi:unnamed protein product, partial [marine sediment metagenome]